MTQADSVHSTPPTNTSANNPPGDPERPQESFYLPTDISPEEVFKAIGRLRKEARDEIDRLIRFLDDSDNHMEREEAVDDVACDTDELEPSLCGVTAAGANMSDIREDDMEGDDTPSGRSAEDEPSLGSVEGPDWGGQEHWAQGARGDREEACEDEGVGA